MHDYMAKVGNTSRAERRQKRKLVVSISFCIIAVLSLLGATALIN